MLAPISSFQPQIQSSHHTQHVFENKQQNNDTNEKESLKSESSKLTKKARTELSHAEQTRITRLKSRDLEVKAHEQAHLSVAGSFATGGASFTYTSGPNGQRYATGGEVGIDISPVAGDPAATIKKAQTIRRAALAPASPSAQDRSVASKASAMLNKAMSQLAEESGNSLNSVEKNQSQQEKPSSNRIINIESDSTAGLLIDVSV